MIELHKGQLGVFLSTQINIYSGWKIRIFLFYLTRHVSNILSAFANRGLCSEKRTQCIYTWIYGLIRIANSVDTGKTAGAVQQVNALQFRSMQQ